MIRNIVSFYKLPWGVRIDNREDWFQDRQEGFLYYSELEGEHCAEELFHITNAPEEMLTEEHKAILAQNDFKGSPLSVGDIVRVTEYPRNPSVFPDYYLCKSFGWEKFEGNTIELVRHLLW